MKKILFMTMLACAAVMMSSCTKVVEADNCKFHAMTIEMPIKSNDWQFDNGANMFFVHFDIPELTASVYDYAVVNVYHEYNTGKNNAYQVLLPETIYKEEAINDSTSVYYQSHIDYVYGIGYVEVFYTISDFFYETGWTPDPMHCRLQVVY